MLDRIRSLSEYQSILEQLAGGKHLAGLGLSRAARLPVVAALYQDLNLPVLLITDRTDHALTLQDELKFWLPTARQYYYPEPNPLFYEHAAWGANTRRDRLNALTSLAAYHFLGSAKPSRPPLLIAPIRAIMTRTLPRRDFIKSSRPIKRGQQIQPEETVQHWVNIGYEAAEIVLEAGQFSRRGGILDIWPAAEDYPVRMELFGNEVDTLRKFDPATQRKVENLDSVLVTPAREVLTGKAIELNLPAAQIDEFVLPLVHVAQASILDYLPQPALVLIDDLDRVQSLAVDIEEQAVHLRQENIKEGILPEDFPIPYLSWSEVIDSLSGHAYLELGRTTAGEYTPLAVRFEPDKRYGGRLKEFVDTLRNLAANGEQVEIVSRQMLRLKELWTEQDEVQSKTNMIEFVEGTLTEGWLLHTPQGRAHLLTDSEIFGWDRPQPRSHARVTAEAPEAVYADLKPGDWVVHVDYGIGRYTGLVHRVLDGAEREFLCIEYDGGDQLFVPVYQADRLSRYIGPDGEAPSPTRLGTAEWTNAKQHVREAVQEIAHELLELYARRQVAEGYAFAPDGPWQQDLEASFPYVETADQLKAINEVKRDMEKPRPMDRLLCGDVGYGKTEVALRAAFKAVMDGRQVAMLVPTTVLAQQHYDTFRERLAAYPVTVEMLSRFRSPKEQDEILLKLAFGEVDIIIGTHRLIQPDVQFKDLGLVIIDEEQRFGVTHKEHFKKLRTEVDVLTLTATPIPRTLYMALTGVRDISVINTPPAERLPITTHIGPYSPKLVRQAILREIERGGQVFFVHNRVQTIRAMASHLNKLVPEARVGIAHGQMPEQELSVVMHKFTHNDIDVLLCTSIIESGLDIPNANTLIIDRGDTFGLAQLYQLRGRVGRGGQRAYAYFFRHRRKLPTPEGLERLETIAENTQLGAGYSIAMRDLEMRGAGELLGTRQHGYIASVGFNLYTRLLAQAVRELRTAAHLPEGNEAALGVKELRNPINVDLPVGAGLPMDYIPDQNMRLRLYRRLADIEDLASLEQLNEEFKDRFGPLPGPVQGLLFQIRIKLIAQEIGLASVSVENDQVVLKYPPLPEGVNSRELPALGPNVRVGKNSYWLQLDLSSDTDTWQAQLLEILEKLR